VNTAVRVRLGVELDAQLEVPIGRLRDDIAVAGGFIRNDSAIGDSPIRVSNAVQPSSVDGLEPSSNVTEPASCPDVLAHAASTKVTAIIANIEVTRFMDPPAL
jgi:hypothetical protein